MAPITRGPDRETKQVLHKIFSDDANAQEAWKLCDFKSRKDLINAAKDAEILKRMRWKDPVSQVDELMSEEQINEFKQLPSFFNWMQNTHGTTPKHPVDVVPENVRKTFELFLVMGPTERQTSDPQGEVLYNPQLAAESEKRNMLNAPNPAANTASATSTTSSNSGLTTPTTCRSNAAKALLTFEKKIRPNEDTWTKFDNAAEWTTWKVKHLGIMTLNDLSEITEDGYNVPAAGRDDPDEVTLYKKKNTLLFMALQESVQTSEGLTIIKKHTAKMDGVAVWKELCKHYDDDIAAETRTKYLLGLICANKIPINHRGLAAEIEKFNRWVIEHNHFCTPSQSISDQQRLIYFERYIEDIEDLKVTRKVMAMQEDAVLGNQAVSRSPDAKIGFYYRQAQELDADHKNKVIKARRKIYASMGHL